MNESAVPVRRNMDVIVPPHPTPPEPPNRKWVIFSHWARKWVKFRVRKWVRDRVPKLKPKGLILWWSNWSTFWCPKWSHGALSDLVL